MPNGHSLPATGSPAAENVTARLISQLMEVIASGALKPGGRLPSERELAKELGSSRASLRSALKVLESVGVITQRVGAGSFLSPDASRVLSMPLRFMVLLDGITLVDVFEARLMLEPELAARAAESASAEDLAALRRSLATQLSDNMNADIAFHDAICRATRNRTCHRVLGAMHGAFRQGMELTARLAPPEHALRFHKAIYSAIHLRQPDEARRRMVEHLNDAKNLLVEACLEQELPCLLGSSFRGRDTQAGDPREASAAIALGTRR